MTDSALPAAMVFAAMGLMLSFAARTIAALSIALAVLMAFAASAVASDTIVNQAATIACWGVILVMAVLTFWPRQWPALVTIAVSGAAGFVAGAVIALAATPPKLWLAMLVILVVLPATLAVERGYNIVPRVVMSWLLAVAMLAALLPYVVSHPGYIPDHQG